MSQRSTAASAICFTTTMHSENTHIQSYTYARIHTCSDGGHGRAQQLVHRCVSNPFSHPICSGSSRALQSRSTVDGLSVSVRVRMSRTTDGILDVVRGRGNCGGGSGRGGGWAHAGTESASGVRSRGPAYILHRWTKLIVPVETKPISSADKGRIVRITTLAIIADVWSQTRRKFGCRIKLSLSRQGHCALNGECVTR